MQDQHQDRNEAADVAALSACKLSPSLQLLQARGPRNIRMALPAVPRRQLSSQERSFRAAMLAAELAAWQITGGDVLRNSLAPDFIRTYRARSN